MQIQQQATGSGEAVFGPWLITLALSALGLYGARHALVELLDEGGDL